MAPAGDYLAALKSFSYFKTDRSLALPPARILARIGNIGG